MKKKSKLSLISMILLLLCINQSSAQSTMNVVMKNGTTNLYSVATYSMFCFSNDNLIFARSPISIPITDIQKITFTPVTGTDVITAENVPAICVSPNPATDFITIKNALNKDCVVAIYSLTGSQMLSVKINPSVEKINVSNLPKGIYIVKVNNTAAKLIKL